MRRHLSPLSYLALSYSFDPPSGVVERHVYENLSTEDIPAKFWLGSNNLKWKIAELEQCLRFKRHQSLEVEDHDLEHSSCIDAAAKFARECLFKDDSLSNSFEYLITEHPDGLWKSAKFGFNLKCANTMPDSQQYVESQEWYEPRSYEDLRACNWGVHKACLCIAYFLVRLSHPGHVLDPEDIVIGAWTTSDASPLAHSLLSHLRSECLKAQCRVGLLTDGRHTIVYKPKPLNANTRLVDILFLPVHERSVLFLLALAFFNTECTSLIPEERYHHRALLGALNDPSCSTRTAPPASGLPDDVEHLAVSRRSRADFDLYTMQRCPAKYHAFCRWHNAVQAQALAAPLTAGSTLRIHPHAFSRCYLLHRSPFPGVKIPDTTLATVSHPQHRRPRDGSVDAALSSSSYVEFEVTDVVRAGPRQWSQIFFGRVRCTTRKLCLKLLDERYFHMPLPPSYTATEAVDERLTTYNCAPDLARREESVYARLSGFQGTLIPHCYGFHEFVDSGGWRSLGVLLELIPGPSLADLPKTPLSMNLKHTVVTQLRHCFRILKCHDIHQTDWHANQILCARPFDTAAHSAGLQFVVIDFAFALQCLGDDCGCYDTDEWHKLYRLVQDVLTLPNDKIEEWWTAREEYEW